MARSRTVVAVLSLFFACWLNSETAHGANILGIFPTNTQSHYVMYGRLMKAMVAKGHNVTVVNHFPLKEPLENFTDISLDGTLPALSNNISIDVPLSRSPIGNHLDMIYDCIESCEIGLKHPKVLELLDKKSYKFDLFVTEIFGSECFLAIAHKLDIPSVGVVSSVNLPWVNDMVANPDNPSYVPLYFSPLTQWMNFYERLYNTVMTVVIKASYEILANWPAQSMAEQILGPLPSISSMARNFSLILLNSHYTINQVRPWVPQIVEVGGLHIQELQPLPKELEWFLNESTNGVVYFSFGSMVKIESIHPEKLQQIITALGKLKQNVLWKVNATNLPKLPPNIRTGSWMPQLEVLCHKNVKVFISHGGLLGSQEAIKCGVPILGVPLFADQALNLAELERRGVAQVINYYDINQQTFEGALNTLINDESYGTKMKYLSELFLDRPQHPMQTATYWLEYVIKYKGARHLRSAALELSWYQYLLLDVIAFILVVVYLIYKSIRIILRKVTKTTTNKDKMSHTNGVSNNVTFKNGHIHKTNGHVINGHINKTNGLVNGHIKTNGYINSPSHVNGNGYTQIDKTNSIKNYENGEYILYRDAPSYNSLDKIIHRIEQFCVTTDHSKWE